MTAFPTPPSWNRTSGRISPPRPNRPHPQKTRGPGSLPGAFPCFIKEKACGHCPQAEPSCWCPGGDSNSHAIRRYHLKIVCLPIPPPGHSCFCIKKPRPWQVFFPAFFKFSRNRPKRQTHATEKAPDPGLRHHAGAALRLTDAPSTDIVIVTSAFREPDGGRAANPARSERKQR